MDDYKNFVDRMGSFEDYFDLGGDITHHKKVITRNRSAMIPNNKESNSLKHYGVLGMRWGRSRLVNANTVGATARTGQSVAALGQAVNKGRFNKKVITEAKKLTDDDLKNITSRLELENRYMNAQTQQSGRSSVESILTTTVATMAVISSAAAMVEAINKARG